MKKERSYSSFQSSWVNQGAKALFTVILCASFISVSPVNAEETVKPIISHGSSFTIIDGSEGDYTFEYKITDEKGNLTSKYYNIEPNNLDFDTDPMGVLKTIIWEEVSKSGERTVAIKFPNNVTKYYKYTYITPDEWNNSTRVESPVGDVTEFLFLGNEVTDKNGGAIYNAGKIGNITADFVGNNASSRDSVYGGAIYHGGTMGNIVGNFVGNFVANTGTNYGSGYSVDAFGGAMYDKGSISSIDGDFIGNYTRGFSSRGGAIYVARPSSSEKIDKISGDFISNYSESGFDNGAAQGGAIYNLGVISEINSTFLSNYILGSKRATCYGAAIANKNKIEYLNSTFIGNYAYSAAGANAFGGAIINVPEPSIAPSNISIGKIEGVFIGNYARSKNHALGGAIHNWINDNDYATAVINEINASFYNNYVENLQGNSVYTGGGAISNRGDLNRINADFVGNHAIGVAPTKGGAIFNDKGNISYITGNFVGNYVLSTSYAATGGAIYNNSEISKKDSSGNIIGGIINSNFYNNYAKSNNSSAQGGAIFTNKDLNIIADNGTSTFKGNYVQKGNGAEDYQAIYVNSASADVNLIARNNGIISMYDYIDGRTGYDVNIKGDETGTLNLYNDIKNANVNVNTVTVNMADGDMRTYEFYKLNSDANAKYVIDIDFANETSDKIKTSNKSEGVITIDSLQIANELTTTPDETYKIQILYTQQDSLQLALSKELESQLGNDEMKLGVSVEKVFDTIKNTTNWDDQYYTSEQQVDIYGKMGLATTNTTNDSIGISVLRTEKGDLVFKGSQGDTLALWNGLNTTELKNFEFSDASNVYEVSSDLGETGGTVLNINGVLDEDTRSTINLNYHKGFEVGDSKTLNISNVTLTQGYGDKGSAIEVSGDSIINLTNVNLLNNVSSSNGAAIYSNSNVNIIADGAISTIANNYSNDISEAIYMGNSDAELNFRLENNGQIVMKDSINGKVDKITKTQEDGTAIEEITNAYRVNIQGDGISDTVFYMFNDINDANLTVGGTKINTINDDVHTYNFNNLTLTGDTTFVADVDLALEKMDRFSANSYGDHAGNLLNVIGLNLLSDAPLDRPVTEIYFAQQGLKDNVVINGNTEGSFEIPQSSYQTTAYTPIYKYNVTYENREDAGYFVFARGGSQGGNASDSFNPAVLSTPVANQSGTKAIVNETVRYAFQHADLFSQLPYQQRMALINENKYAVEEVVNPENSVFDGKIKAPIYNSDFEYVKRGYWTKPFTSFDKISLSNGPKVDVITYGNMFGYDGNFREMKHGWYNIQTVYGGYNGSVMNYGGVDTTLNGGTLGLTETFYKGNFFAAVTGVAGANAGSSQTMYGNEDFKILLGGIGAKSGYNFEFKNGKYILQSILFTNYNFVNTFDYTNAAGVRIKSSPSHTLQVNPQIKLIGNFKNGWQPYANVGVVWNVLNTSDVKANNIVLPKMTIDPYVEYGLGIQRLWKERFTGFGQVMVRNGGRSGVALSFGFRWAIGKKESDL